MKTLTAALDEFKADREYDWPEPHVEHFHLVKCNPLADECRFWAAATGVAFGLKVLSGSTCIANVESILADTTGVNRADVYVVFQLKNPTQSTWKRWAEKWSKRTAPRDLTPFIASFTPA